MTLMMTGCVRETIQEDTEVLPTLSPAEVPYQAPDGDFITGGAELWTLYLPGKNGLNLLAQHVAQRLGTMDMERSRTAQKSERRDHADEPEAVVAVQVGDKHMAELGEAGMAATQLHLRALAAVDHHQLATDLDQL